MSGAGHTRPTSHLSVWMHLGAAEAGVYLAEVDRLRRQWDAPLFAPHVTLIGGFDTEESDATARARGLAAELDRTTVEFDGVGSEEPLHKSVFLTAVPSPVLDRAFDAAVRAFTGLFTPEPFRPHLSLAYLNEPLHRKREAAASVRLPLPSTALLTTLALWRTPMPDVRRWTKVAEWPL